MLLGHVIISSYFALAVSHPPPHTTYFYFLIQIFFLFLSQKRYDHQHPRFHSAVDVSFNPAHCEPVWRTVHVGEVCLNVPLHAITINITLFSPRKQNTFFTQWNYLALLLVVKLFK